MAALIAFGIMTAAGGAFLLLWYRTIVALPASVRPAFTGTPTFKWGAPLISTVLFLMGLWLVAVVKPWAAAVAFLVFAILAGLLIRYDRYTANMRMIYDRYRRIRDANEEMEEMEVLYQTARWRYPEWSEDRVVELVGGKDIESMMLLIVISENRIHPITDWELYRKLKKAAAGMARSR